MDLCAIGSRIKAAREKAGMTQEDLAAALEMSPTHISVIERGVKAPKLETLVNIANVLKTFGDILLLLKLLHPDIRLYILLHGNLHCGNPGESLFGHINTLSSWQEYRNPAAYR